MMVTLDPAEKTRRANERIAEQQLAETRAAALADLADRLGVELHDGAWLCATRLTDRGHVCNTRKCNQATAAGGDEMPDTRTFDHIEWMRETADGRWVLLIQPYQYDPVELTAWCAERGITWEDLGEPSPHGCGTHTVSIRGI